MPVEPRQFRTAFVVEPSHDFSALRDHCLDLRFLSTGMERSYRDLLENVDSVLNDFEPDQDVLIPTGHLWVTFVVGMHLVKRFGGNGTPVPAVVGIFYNGQYNFMDVEL